MTEAIQLVDISKSYPRTRGWRALLPWRRPDHVVAVDGVSLSIHEGEFFGLLGPNGAGKTTLIKMLCGLVLPNRGSACIHGFDIVGDAEIVREMIALVDGQERSFFWRLTGRENLEFFAALYGMRGAAAHRRVDELLELVSLGEPADRRFMTYSSGMKQRLSIARGLLRQPQVLFMDEPTRSLDPISARQVRDLTRHQLVDRLGCTVVWCTHYMAEAEELCDRVAIVNHGRIIACHSPAEIKHLIPVRAACQMRVAGLDGQAVAQLTEMSVFQHVSCESAGNGEVSLDVLLDDHPDALAVALQSVADMGGVIRQCATREATLEEAFAYLVNGGPAA